MSIRKHGRGFQVRLSGERAKTLPTRAAADRYELNRKLARSLGDLHGEPPVTVEQLLDGYLERWQARRQPAVSTVKRARECMLIWRQTFGDRLLSRLSAIEVEDVIVARAGGHPNAAKKELEWLKRALRDGRRRRQTFDQALLDLDPIRVVGRTGIALDLDELDRLGSWFPEHLSLFPHVVASLALRVGEALALTDDRVDVIARPGTVFVPAGMCKERRDKLIMLTAGERAMLAEQLVARPAGTPYVFPRAGGQPTVRGGKHHQPGRWDKGDFYARVWHPARDAAARELRQERGLPAFAETRFDTLVPHDLRHTGISLMAASGMRPETIAERVGHKDGGRLILERYRHLFPDEIGTHLERYETYMSERRERGRTEETGS